MLSRPSRHRSVGESIGIATSILAVAVMPGCTKLESPPALPPLPGPPENTVDLRQTSTLSVPSDFSIQARLLSIGLDMAMKNEQGNFGFIEQRVINLTPTFEIFDAGHQLQARARQQAFSFGTKIHITDANGGALGSVEENVFKSLFRIKTSYSVKGPNGEVLATSEKLDWAGTKVAIKSPGGQVVATMKRPMLDWGGATWTVNIMEGTNIDRRLILFIPAFKTLADHGRSSHSSGHHK